MSAVLLNKSMRLSAPRAVSAVGSRSMPMRARVAAPPASNRRDRVIRRIQWVPRPPILSLLSKWVPRPPILSLLSKLVALPPVEAMATSSMTCKIKTALETREVGGPPPSGGHGHQHEAVQANQMTLELISSMTGKIKAALETEEVIISDAYGDAQHVSIDVVSALFEGKNSMTRQRMVYKVPSSRYFSPRSSRRGVSLPQSSSVFSTVLSAVSQRRRRGFLPSRIPVLPVRRRRFFSPVVRRFFPLASRFPPSSRGFPHPVLVAVFIPRLRRGFSPRRSSQVSLHRRLRGFSPPYVVAVFSPVVVAVFSPRLVAVFSPSLCVSPPRLVAGFPPPVFFAVSSPPSSSRISPRVVAGLLPPSSSAVSPRRRSRFSSPRRRPRFLPSAIRFPPPSSVVFLSPRPYVRFSPPVVVRFSRVRSSRFGPPVVLAFPPLVVGCLPIRPSGLLPPYLAFAVFSPSSSAVSPPVVVARGFAPPVVVRFSPSSSRFLPPSRLRGFSPPSSSRFLPRRRRGFSPSSPCFPPPVVVAVSPRRRSRGFSPPVVARFLPLSRRPRFLPSFFAVLPPYFVAFLPSSSRLPPVSSRLSHRRRRGFLAVFSRFLPVVVAVFSPSFFGGFSPSASRFYFYPVLVRFIPVLVARSPSSSGFLHVVVAVFSPPSFAVSSPVVRHVLPVRRSRFSPPAVVARFLPPSSSRVVSPRIVRFHPPGVGQRCFLPVVSRFFSPSSSGSHRSSSGFPLRRRGFSPPLFLSSLFSFSYSCRGVLVGLGHLPFAPLPPGPSGGAAEHRAIWEELQSAVHAVDAMSTKTPEEAVK
eukprot:gene7177-283_t